MTAVMNFDASILLWLQNSLRNGALTAFNIFVTHLGDAGILWVALTLALMISRKTRRVGVTCAISMTIGLLVVNVVLKNWVARIRPYEVIEGLELLIERQHDFSFPSGHATNSLACARVLFRRLDKKYGVPALVLALLICFSRLYVAVHYPTDVIAGIIIGILSAEIAIRLVRILRKHFPAFRRFTSAKPKKRKRA